jgi:hypothetical protein
MARDRFREGNIHNLRLRIIESRLIDERVQNLPTCFEIAVIIVNDIGADDAYRDVIVDYKEGGLQMINKLHLSFMSLQYLLLLPYGKDGYKLGILRKNTNENGYNIDKYVAMREFYAYWLQERQGKGHTLIYSSRLFQ